MWPDSGSQNEGLSTKKGPLEDYCPGAMVLYSGYTYAQPASQPAAFAALTKKEKGQFSAGVTVGQARPMEPFRRRGA